MKVNSILSNSSPSSTLPDSFDYEKEDKSNQQHIITYPYQDQLKSILDPTWLSLLLAVTVLIVAAEFIHNPEEFFYPCKYEGNTSVNDTLKLKSKFNEIQNIIQTYRSHLSTVPEITVTENEKHNLYLKNAIEESAAIKQEYDYHKTRWTKCFTQNRDNFGAKVKTSQSIFSILGSALSLYQIFKCIQYTSKLKKRNLTKAQRKAYEKDWRGLNGFKTYLILKFLLFTLFIGLFRISLWKIYPTEMLFFN